MDYKEYQGVIDKEIEPLHSQMMKYEALRALGSAIKETWEDVGFGTKDLDFGDIVVPPSPKYSPYIHAFDPQIEPLAEGDIKDLMSTVEEWYQDIISFTGTSLSYVRPTADQLEISVVFNK